MKPWEQQRSESGQAYKAFCVYRDLGLERQIKLAYRTATKRPNSDQVSGRWSQWAKRYEWEQRARAYDAHLANVEQQAREREVARRATEIERRRKEAQDVAWALFEELKAKLQQMLKLPVITVTDADGQKTVNPAKWDYNSVARSLEALDLSMIAAIVFQALVMLLSE